VLSCEVDHNLVGRTACCCCSAEIAISTETTKEKIGVSIDHDLLLSPSRIHMLPFYYTHGKNKSLKHQHFLTRYRDPAHKYCMLGNYSRQFAVLCDATKLLLKVALNTITLTLNTIYIDALSYNI
jgi:hypothetical protein